MFCGFVFSGYVLFDPRSDDFKTLQSSSVTLLRMSIGDIEFHKFIEGDRQIAPMYVFVHRFILLHHDKHFPIHYFGRLAQREEEIRDNPRKQEDIRLTELREMAMKYAKTIVTPGTYLQILDIFRNPRSWPKFVWKKCCGKREDMGLEIKERLKLWRNKRQNQDYNFVDFPLIVKALEGGHLNHEDVSDEQVQKSGNVQAAPELQILYIYDKKQMEEKDKALNKVKIVLQVWTSLLPKM